MFSPYLLDSDTFVDECGNLNSNGYLFLSLCFSVITSCLLKTLFSKSS